MTAPDSGRVAAPPGSHPSGHAGCAVDGAPRFDPSRGCQCRLCRYDVEFAEHLAFVPEEHRAFSEELKESWEAMDFDSSWFRGCVGGEDFTVEFCQRYDAEREKVTRRARDRDATLRRREAAEGEASQPGPPEEEASPDPSATLSSYNQKERG